MLATTTFRAQGYARALYDRLTVAQHYEEHNQHPLAARELEDTTLWLRLCADALGFDIVQKTAPAQPDALDELIGKINASVLGVKS